MTFGQRYRLGILFMFGVVSYGIVGCDATNESSPGTTQTPGSGGASNKSGSSEDTVSTGGKTTSKAASTKGGNSGRGGAKNSSQEQQEAGGAESDPGNDEGGSSAAETSATGGATTKSSSKSSSGGASHNSSTADAAENGGSGNSSSKGGAAAGGKSSSPRSSAAGGKSATSTGGVGNGGGSASGGSTTATGSGDCKKGQVAAKEVAILGESFYAMAPQYIQKRIEENAKKAGAIGSGDSYRNVAISGQPMSVVVGEFDTALKGGAVKVVIMDGGGIDCMSSSCPDCPNLFKNLLTKMASNGVQSVIYTRYPEPGNPPGSNATLKKNLDALMPEMEKVCKASTSPPCYWVDLRPVWVNGDTSDGLHPTQSGGNHCGDAIWAEMVKQCIAQ